MKTKLYKSEENIEWVLKINKTNKKSEKNIF